MLAPRLFSATHRLTVRSLSSTATKLKLYSHPGTPSPDAVHMYLHEASAEDLVEVERVNVNKGANRSEEYVRTINPMGEVPALQCPSGAILTESMAICKYLDDFRTDGRGSSLVGESAEERAITEAWVARVDSKMLVPMMWAFRCGPMAKWFADRTPGYIHPEVAKPMESSARVGLQFLDASFAADGRQFLCGDRFTIADIRLYTYYKFLTAVAKSLAAGSEQPAFGEYIARVGARPSALAIKPKKK